VRTFDFASKATSPGSPDELYSRLRAEGLRPETCWIAFDITEEPIPSSSGEYGGDKQLERRYNDGSKDGECQLSKVLRVLVSVLRMIILERVPDNVTRA